MATQREELEVVFGTAGAKGLATRYRRSLVGRLFVGAKRRRVPVTTWSQFCAQFGKQLTPGEQIWSWFPGWTQRQASSEFLNVIEGWSDVGGLRKTEEDVIRREVAHEETVSSIFAQQRRESAEVHHQMELANAKRRAEAAERRADELLQQNDKLFAFVRDLSTAKDALQEAIVARDSGRLCLHAVNQGFVLRRLDDDAAIEFRNAAGESIEQVYSSEQFIGGTLPDTGDEIEAHVFAWRRRPKPKDIREFLTAEEIQHGFRGFREAIEQRNRE